MSIKHRWSRRKDSASKDKDADNELCAQGKIQESGLYLIKMRFNTLKYYSKLYL